MTCEDITTKEIITDKRKPFLTNKSHCFARLQFKQYQDWKMPLKRFAEVWNFQEKYENVSFFIKFVWYIFYQPSNIKYINIK